MKRILFIAMFGLLLTSCMVVPQQTSIIPKAINTVNTASFKELNLDRADYEVLNTISAEAVVERKQDKKDTRVELYDPDKEFTLIYTKGKTGFWECQHAGIVKLGYLQNDYSYDSNDLMYGENLARRLAIYRLINIAQQNGADGIIEPTVSTNVEQQGKTIIFKSVVSAKIIRLKTNN